MKWFLYNLLFHVGYGAMLPFYLPKLIRRGNFRARFGERFGRFAPDVAARLREKPRVWVHAVSVGEAKLAGTLINELRRRKPEDTYIISTTSTTGRAVCEKFAAPDDVVIYLPIDFTGCVRRALRVVNARALILVEAEIWPNLIRRVKCPVVLACARISDKSAPNYKRLRWWLKDVFKCFAVMLAQSETDRARLVAAGADAGKITVTGSAKFDAPPPDAGAAEKARATFALAGIDADKDFVVLGGSTWPGEEAALARAWKGMPGARLVIVPRHAERGDEIEAELRGMGVEIIRKSKIGKLGNCKIAKLGGNFMFLVDTTGELSALYHHASVVFVGKSLPPNKGAQNMIEPAALGKPVVTGPNSQNFTSVMEPFRAANAIAEVQNSGELAEKLLFLAMNKTERDALGARAKAVVESQRGALARTADEIVSTIK